MVIEPYQIPHREAGLLVTAQPLCTKICVTEIATSRRKWAHGMIAQDGAHGETDFNLPLRSSS
jgi:hypothetical protein